MIAERRWSVSVEGLVCKEQKVLYVHQQGHFLLTHSKKTQIQEFRTKTAVLKAMYPTRFGGWNVSCGLLLTFV